MSTAAGDLGDGHAFLTAVANVRTRLVDAADRSQRAYVAGPAQGRLDRSVHRDALWIAGAMAGSDMTPLSPEDVDALERLCRPRALAAGTVLVQTGATADEVFIVRKGEVHLAIRQPMRGRQIVGIVRPGSAVADISMLCQHGMAVDAIATRGCVVLGFSRNDLLRLLQQSPALSLRWATSIAASTARVQSRLIMLLTKDLHQQVATVLLEERTQRLDGSAVVHLPQRTLADLLGARRQSVSRVLADFKLEGLIATGYGKTRILDIDRLAERAGTDVDSLHGAVAPADSTTGSAGRFRPSPARQTWATRAN